MIPGPIIEELNLELKDLDKNLELKDLELDEDDGDVKSDPMKRWRPKHMRNLLHMRRFLLHKKRWGPSPSQGGSGSWASRHLQGGTSVHLQGGLEPRVGVDDREEEEGA